MPIWSAIVVLVFAIALAAKPTSGDGWFWELGNGFGFLALAFLLVIVLNGRAKLGHSTRHRWLGLAVLIAIFVHILWFLVGDSVVWEYLKWGAPHYMVAGILSAGLVLVTTLSSLNSLRMHSYNGYKNFQKWHQRLSIAVILSAFIHVVLSGFYIQQMWQIVLLAIVVLAAYYLPLSERVSGSFVRLNMLLVGTLALAVFAFLRIDFDL